jgi:hypothetical protein
MRFILLYRYAIKRIRHLDGSMRVTSYNMNTTLIQLLQSLIENCYYFSEKKRFKPIFQMKNYLQKYRYFTQGLDSFQ